MKVQIPYRFKQSVYLINDIDQIEYLVHRIILEPKGKIVLELFAPNGDYFEVPEDYVLNEKDKLTGLKKEEDEI